MPRFRGLDHFVPVFMICATSVASRGWDGRESWRGQFCRLIFRPPFERPVLMGEVRTRVWLLSMDLTGTVDELSKSFENLEKL